MALARKDRYFAFKNKEAVENVSLDSYSIAELNELERRVNFDSLATHIHETKTWRMRAEAKVLKMCAAPQK